MPDILGLCERLEAEHIDIPRPARPLKHGGPKSSIIALVRNPNGYMIELAERA